MHLVLEVRPLSSEVPGGLTGGCARTIDECFGGEELVSMPVFNHVWSSKTISISMQMISSVLCLCSAYRSTVN